MPRNANALICQDGASNERRVASCLVEAIDECRAAGLNPRQDPACFLILHQLAHLLTGFDIACGIHALGERYGQDYNKLANEARDQADARAAA